MSNATTAGRVRRIGVGIDTARYGHYVSFLRDDRQPAAPALAIQETREGYDRLADQLGALQQRYPGVEFCVRIDAAGQYASNLERHLRSLPLPLCVSVGEPKRNKDYRQAHFPKRKADPVESLAMARYAVVELPGATEEIAGQIRVLREVASRLQGVVKDVTRGINRLHNLLARVFPELAMLSNDLSAGWLLTLLSKYPTPEQIARARLASLTKVVYLTEAKARKLQQAARETVGSLRGEVAAELVRGFVGRVLHDQKEQKSLEKLLQQTYRALPASGHVHLETVTGIGLTTAAVLVAKIVSIDRFETASQLVGYFGVFPEEHSSGVDRQGRPLGSRSQKMSAKGNDLVRRYLWTAALSAIQHNPAVRALYRRLRAGGTRGDVAMGHCMRKLLHLVFAVWKSNRPFDKNHYPWEQPQDPMPTGTDEQKAAGHKGELVPNRKVVTAATGNLADAQSLVKAPAARTDCPAPRPVSAARRGHVDFAYLREQLSIERVLRHLNVLDRLHGTGPQRRGLCPIHGARDGRTRSFSVNLARNVFQCFHPDCRAGGNVLDLWMAAAGLSIYEAALDLAAKFDLQLSRNREEEPVRTSAAIARRLHDGKSLCHHP